MDTSTFFDSYFNNVSVNAMLIMDISGNVLQVNKAFKEHFLYTNEDLKGKNFAELFTSTDKKKLAPEKELKKVIETKQATDENFVLDKEGRAIWCSGESVLAITNTGEKFILKAVINLQARKQLSLLLNNAEEILERIFSTTNDIPIMIIDASMKIIDVNKAFLKFFELQSKPELNSSLSSLGNAFWKSKEVRTHISSVIVTNTPIQRKFFPYRLPNEQLKTLSIDTKIFLQTDLSRKIYILVDEVPNENVIEEDKK